MAEIVDNAGSARQTDIPAASTTGSYGGYGMSGMAPSAGDTTTVSDAEQNRAMGILSYIGILFVVPLIAAKDSRFAMFHANQGLVLCLCGIACGIVAPIPVIGWIIAPLAGIAITIFAIMGIINAVKGEMKPLPLIGGISLIPPPAAPIAH